jgi:ATP-dependent Lhr-like helicase
MDRLGPATAGWFQSNFTQPTPVQAQGWPLIASGQNVLLLAPTGSGKTLAAFLACLDRLFERPDREPLTRVLYISPLKALVYDIERNLRAPLAGIAQYCEGLGRPSPAPTVAIRTGDTPARDRQQQLRRPADIMVTTPESLYLMLGSQMHKTLLHLETIIVDEIHSLAPTKRGAHLSLSLERLAHLCGHEPQRIGLSATVEPVDSVARYLGGPRPVEVVNTLEPPKLDLRIVVPVEDMEKPTVAPVAGGSILGQLMAEEKLRQGGGMGHGMAAEGAGTLWSSIYPQILELIGQHRSTLIFVNSRGLCERLALRLNELSGQEVARSHHGSVSHKERQQIEEMLKAGQLKALVATSSLELGIDMGAVDLVIMVESPGSVARGLQRVGRAGHGVGETSIGRIFPKFRGDLLECTVVAQRMRQGQLEPLRIPENPLDVLAQQIVAMVSGDDWSVTELERVVQRSANYNRLSSEVLREVLDMLSGRYPSHDFADLKPRLTWDRDSDVLTARKGSRTLALVNGGTIPDRGLYRVVLGPGGPRVGELDEEMVHEVRAGQNFLLGATTWRIEEITRDTVYVSAAPGEPGRMPFWRGDGPGRPIEVGRAIGAFVRQMGAEMSRGRLENEYGLDSLAAGNLLNYLHEQQEATGTLPTDRALTVERFRDEIGDWRLCILSPFGSRVHAPWALALEAQLSHQAGFEVQALWTDDGIVLRFADVDELPRLDLALDPELVQDMVIGQLAHSAMFAGQFRENAGRALLLPRKMPGQRTPLWAQRLRAQNLLAVAQQYPSFPIILETYRSCLQDTFDLPHLKELLRDLRTRKIRLQEVETASASPFARSLVFSYVAAYLYQGDAPLAERKAQALTLDRNLLAELLGHEDLRELLDGGVLAELEEELQRLAPERQARHPDDLHNLLRHLGDLSDSEVAARVQGQAGLWLEALERARRLVRIRMSGELRWLAVEDVALYRDALGVQPPGGLPSVFLEAPPHPMESLILRYARTRGPFVLRQLCQRFGLLPHQLEPLLATLVARQQLQAGDFRPGGTEREWCDPEFLRRWRRRTLAKLRGQVAPVETHTLAQFLYQWQTSASGLREVVAQLEGLPLSFAELEKSILPARVVHFQPRQLDELGQLGEIVWVGCGSLGNRDGRIVLCRRERAHLLLEPPDDALLEGCHAALVQFLQQRGACFLMEIRTALRDQYRSEELEEALEDLIWSGHVSNDLFSPLRGLASSSQRKTPRLGGRWVLVQQLLLGGRQVTQTERQHAWAQTLLDRYGVVSREVAQIESLAGSFQPIYQVLRAMEEAGKIRRGYFVEGLSAAQFALAGALDSLRQSRPTRDPGEESSAVVLAATDPANPYGSLLPWPDSSGRPRRVVGARVVLVAGQLVFYLEKGGRKLVAFEAVEKPNIGLAAAHALAGLADQARGKCLRIQEINGQGAALSPFAGLLRECGFRDDYHGLMALGAVHRPSRSFTSSSGVV